MTQHLQPFHLAIPVHCLKEADNFYANLLGCSRGRSCNQWIDYNFFGHQLVCHLDNHYSSKPIHTLVDKANIPVPHFGVVLTSQQWQALSQRLTAHNTEYIVEPTTRFLGLPGEQSTFFISDPSGNTLEFKAFAHIDQLFAS